MFTKLHQLLLFDKKYRLTNKIQRLAVLIINSADGIKLCQVNLHGNKCNACTEFVCCTVLANKRGILPTLLCAFSIFRLLHVTSSLQQSEG